MAPPEPLSPDLLLEHAAFLRGLARSLVLDESRADDVVQEAYMAALRRPPPPRVRLRAWLAAVTRNLALRSRRTDRRVWRRERAGGRRPSPQSPDDIVARLEAQRQIAAAVAELDEPGRSAIVHRYFDGLKPAEIAAREGVSVRTIESRLRRAREKLRERLDRSYGGARSAWTLALAPSLGIAREALTGSAAAAGSSVSPAGTAAVPATSSAALGAAVTGVSLMSTKVVLVVAAFCMAGAFFAGWQLKPAASGEVLAPDEASGPARSAGPQLNADALQLQRARNALSAEREQRKTLEGEVAKMMADLAALGPAPEGAATDPAGATADLTKTRYAFHVTEKALASTDWAEAGTAINKMLPLMVELKTEIAAGRPIPANVGDLQRWNAPLLSLALSLRGKVPGTGTNGVFTHPAVMVNLIFAALAQSKTPLDETQARQLGEIGNRYVAEDGRRLAGYGGDVLRMQMTLEEAALKDRFYADVDRILTAEQQAFLHPPELRGRIGIDLFSSGLVWQELARGISFSDREKLAEAVVKEILTWVGFTPEHRPVVEAAARDWAESFSDAFLDSTDDPVVHASRDTLYKGMLAGWLRVEQAQVAGARQLSLQRALLEQLPARSEAAAAVRATVRLLVPIKEAAER